MFSGRFGTKKELVKLKREAEEQIKEMIKSWFDEDKLFDDITTSLVAPEGKGKLTIFSKDKMQFVAAGVDFIRLIVKEYLKHAQKKKMKVSASVKVKLFKKDGQVVSFADKVAEVEGDMRMLFSLERLILNIVSRLSGIATETKKLAGLSKGVKILSTRKTTPGLRYLEKYAVCVGGGFAHRKNLAEAVLIKDNHIKAVDGIKNLLNIIVRKQSRIKRMIRRGVRFEIEVQNQAELDALLEISKALRRITVMLDNFKYDELKRAIKKIKKFSRRCGVNILIEVSGGVRPENIGKIAKLKPDFISVGYITLQPGVPDISADIVPL